MNINLYIADLLHQQNSVNVPYLGIFRKVSQSAFYDFEQQTYNPPSHTIAFTDQEDESTLLAEYISSQKHVSNSTALYFIEKFVMDIKSLVDLNGQAEFEALGVLKKSPEGYIFINRYKQDEKGEYFGLSPVKELAVNILPLDETQSAQEQPASIIIPLNSVDSTFFEPGEVLIERNRKLSTSSFILLLTSFLVVAVIISYLTYPQVFKFLNQQSSVPVKKIAAKKPVIAKPPMSLDDSLKQADTIYQELTKQGFDVEKPRDTLKVSTEIKTAGIPPSEKPSFEIIGAAFARRAEAETYVKQLQNRGVYAKIVENMPGSKLKISLGTFDNELSAKKELVRIKTDVNKEAWIARVKPKKTK